MKKFFNSFKFILKAFLLVIILLLGWVFINITNLIKGKKASDKDSLSANLFGADGASADSPPSGPSCPFVAYFDGKKFQIENDFLCGKFSQYWRSSLSKLDLLKFNNIPQKRGSKLAFQLQENEAEESFINRLKFIRVVHPKSSEIIVDSGFERFHVIERALLEKITPAKEVLVNGVKDISNRFNDQKKFFTNEFDSDSLILNKNDRLEFVFSGLKYGATPILIVKSTFRDFIIGEVDDVKKTPPLSSLIYSPVAFKLGLLFMAALYFVFGRKTFGNWPAFLPIIFGVQAPGHSIIISYRDETGNFRQAAINRPRVWNFNSEAIVLPKEAIIEDGIMHIKAEFTKRHKLAFAGILQDKMSLLSYRSEELNVKSAQSSRLGDVIELLSEKNKKSLHLIPGDTVDIEIEEPKISLHQNEKETYLMQSFGIYTPLSSKYKKLAGDWLKKIPAEIKAYYEQVANK